MFTCGICYVKRSLKHLRLLPCGHGFCEHCLHQYFDRRERGGRTGGAPCPMCKADTRKSDIRSMYPSMASDAMSSDDERDEADLKVSHSEAVLKQAKHVADKIKDMDADNEWRSVDRIAREVQKVADGIDDAEHEDTVQTLLSVIKDFKQRIVPQFAKLADQKKQLTEKERQILLKTREANSKSRELHEKEAELEKVKQKVLSCASRNKALESEVLQSEELLKDAVNTADTAHGRYQDECKKNSQLRLSVKEKEDEISRQRRTILSHKEQERKRQDKIKDLKKQLEDRDQSIADLQTSLEKATQAQAFSLDSEDDESIHESQSDFYYDIGNHSEKDFAVDSRMIPTSDSDEFDYYNVEPPLYEPRQPSQSQASTSKYAPQIQKPVFRSEWTLQRPQGQGKRKQSKDHDEGDGNPVKKYMKSALGLDANGRPVGKGTLQLGDRRKLTRKL